MTTIADELLACGPLSEGEAYARRARERLAPLWDGNHIFAAHGSVGPALAADADRSARRFVCGLSTVLSAYAIFDDEKSKHIAAALARMPFPVIWIEWPMAEGHSISAMIEARTDGAVNILSFFRPRGGRPLWFAAIEAHQLTQTYEPSRPDIVGRCASWHEGTGPGSLMNQIVCLIALINLGGPVQVGEHRWSEALQKSRRRKGQLPLLSYNTVEIRRRETGRRQGGAQTHGGRRLHECIGYLRVSRHGKVDAHYTWVDHHWRGNIEKGMVINGRVLT